MYRGNCRGGRETRVGVGMGRGSAYGAGRDIKSSGEFEISHTNG